MIVLLLALVAACGGSAPSGEAETPPVTERVHGEADRAPSSAATESSVRLAAGERHTCSWSGSGGPVACWGANEMGQLGDGTILRRDRPMVAAGVDAVEVAGGEEVTCARTADGRVWCWGI